MVIQVLDRMSNLDDQALKDRGLPFQSVLEGIDSALFGVVATVSLTGSTTERFNATDQETLVSALREVLAAGASAMELTDVQVTGLENAGDATHSLVVQVAAAVDGKESRLSGLAQAVQSAVHSEQLKVPARALSDVCRCCVVSVTDAWHGGRRRCWRGGWG